MKKKILISIVSGSIGVLILFHITPYNALRTHLFFTGHPLIALTTSFNEDIIHKEQETKKLKFYIVNKSPIDRETGNYMTTYKVIKRGIFFFASYYGEG